MRRIGGAENRRSRNQKLGTGRAAVGGVVGVDPAVDLDWQVQAAARDLPRLLADFVQGPGLKGLAAEAGFDRHDQGQVQLFEVWEERRDRSAGIDCQAAFEAVAADSRKDRAGVG